ncbi:Enoyl-CoA hydratase [uncultured Mycobacterium sp.]|uniref:Enoyl-CoA hydratase n=1 Tax=uncultured Mycobacterium sp. TaxID=171292 RepID=A0A1Y5PD08_9MYCO|nr:Enoyl-CoA hydratase [uncultured Mycobacterium sp.]
MTTIDAYPGIPELNVSLDGGLLTVTLNRPDSLNSLNSAMLRALADVLAHAADDPAVRVVRLGGAGRGFSSGAGISAEDQSDRRPDTPDEVLTEANRAVQTIVGLPKPVVAVVQGPTAGVGVSLALACDIVLASEKAFFLLAFTKIGLMPDGGASALVAASIGRARAMKMALLAERVSAAEALSSGLVSAVYPADELEAGVAAVIDKLASGPAVALRKTKQAINAATLTELDAAIGRESEGQLILLGTKDFREGTKAFQEHRSPTFTDS